MTVQDLRNEYRGCQKRSGLTPEQFRYECSWFGMLSQRGESGRGDRFEMTPQEWVTCAREVEAIHTPHGQMVMSL